MFSPIFFFITLLHKLNKYFLTNLVFLKSLETKVLRAIHFWTFWKFLLSLCLAFTTTQCSPHPCMAIYTCSPSRLGYLKVFKKDQIFKKDSQMSINAPYLRVASWLIQKGIVVPRMQQRQKHLPLSLLFKGFHFHRARPIVTLRTRK